MAAFAESDSSLPSDRKFRNTGGPHGLGDPDDKSLRKVELEVMIPKKMRDIARAEKCSKEVEEFTLCCKDSKLSMFYTCRKENTALWGCLEKWYKDEEFKEQCKIEYLAERSEYRRTGMTRKERQRLQTSGF
ncbi:COX assembly mitochondrial protein homolog [Macrobrachium nipponense]|uniref:COX assembly mitochondrial protein homolog n=1 Tax=Macrobrachium nipponense TaxID=159736 RepID=UPI0030C83D2A